MAYEPFSKTTRSIRTSLLFVSATSLLTSQFDITLENIPGVGFEFNLPSSFLGTVLLFLTLYYMVSFILYAGDDLRYGQLPSPIKNAQFLETRAQDLRDEWKTLLYKAGWQISGRPQDFQFYKELKLMEHIPSVPEAGADDIASFPDQTIEGMVDEETFTRICEVKHEIFVADMLNDAAKREASKITPFRIYIWDLGLPLFAGLVSLFW